MIKENYKEICDGKHCDIAERSDVIKISGKLKLVLLNLTVQQRKVDSKLM